MPISTLWLLSLHQRPCGVRITDQIRAQSREGAEGGSQTPLSATWESGTAWGLGDTSGCSVLPPATSGPCLLRPQKGSSLQTMKWSDPEDGWLGLWAEITEAHVQEKRRLLLPKAEKWREGLMDGTWENV